MTRVIATVIEFSHLPPSSVYHGNGQFEFDKLPGIVKERLLEVDDKGQEVFRKPSFNKNIKGNKV